MGLDSEAKKAIMADHKLHDSDTGSPEVQIALLTTRIKQITEHLKVFKKDFHTRRSLMVLIGRRKRLLNYLIKNDIERYRQIIKKLGIRK